LIELSDNQAAALKAQAEARGLTLENWIQKLAASTSPLDWAQCPAVESVPGKVSGAWVLRRHFGGLGMGPPSKWRCSGSRRAGWI
jgi:hypothetical protein